jgi:hypothetical protein
MSPNLLLAMSPNLLLGMSPNLILGMSFEEGRDRKPFT